MYISIYKYTDKVANPYYQSSFAKHIEPEYIDEEKTFVQYFNNIEDLKKHIKRESSLIGRKGSYTYYKAEKLTPSVTIEVVVDI